MKPRKSTDAKERIMPFISKDGITGCWNWTGRLNKNIFHGRGVLHIAGKRVLAYRAMYEAHKGKIPEGLVIHHICENPKCCNPDHLTPITQDQNTKIGAGPAAKNIRKTHCPRGHEYSEANTMWSSGKTRAPFRTCRICYLARKKKNC